MGAIHTVFLREHNRIAKQLKLQNPRLNEELLFQNARRIVNAEWQHIIYNEFLPTLLGQTILNKFGLATLTQGFSTAYKPLENPSVTNVFAGAAFRMGHTLVTDVVR